MTNSFDLWVASLGDSVTTEANVLLRLVFDQHGPVITIRALSVRFSSQRPG